MAVLQRVPFPPAGRAMQCMGAGAAAFAVLLGAVTPADAGLSRRLKFRAEQDLKRDTGPQIPPGQLHIIISIKSQRVAVYSDGVLAAKSNVSTGVPDHPTPTGVFSIIQKNRYHRSNIYSGAPMPFMQRITWSGIALHQGVLPGRPASHGCIRLSQDFAQRMWKRTRLGARVIIAQNEVAPYAFTHPKLFKPAALTADIDVSAVKTAKAETTASDAEAPVPATDQLPLPDYPPIADVTADIRKTIHEENPDAKKRATPSGPVSVFISRKERKLYVRRGFDPLFETMVTIADDAKPFGTHVFTATEPSDQGMKWVAVSLPVDVPKVKIEKRAKAERVARRYGRNIARNTKVAPPPAHQPVTPDAASVLERIDIPKDAIARIEALMGPGASLIVADTGLGYETGEGTDFIVVTR